MLVLGYDPGGKGTHGVAAIEVSDDGIIVTDPICDVVEDAEAAWDWLSSYRDPSALGIDTLLAWSAHGGRACDNALRKAYPRHAATVIPQNALYSSMKINGAIIARRGEIAGPPMFESHPKLFVRTTLNNDAATESILAHYQGIQCQGSDSPKAAKRADDMADAVVAAWCASQGLSQRWSVNLFDAPGDRLEEVASGVTYPWPENVFSRPIGAA